MRNAWQTVLVASSLLALWSCDSGTDPKPSTTRTTPMTVDCGAPSSCTPANSAMIELTCPQKGDTLLPGDTVVMRWRANVGTGDFTSFIPWRKSSTDSAYISAATVASIEYSAADGDNQCFSYSAVLPSTMAAGFASFRISDYTPSIANLRSVVDSVLIVAP